MKIRLIGQLKYRSSRVYLFTFYCCLFSAGLSACLSEGQGPVVTSQFSPRLAYPDAPYGREVGDRIEDLRFVGLDGENVGLSELYFDSRTRLLLVTTSAEWCTACIKEQPKLEDLYQRYRSRGLNVLVALFEDANFEPATPALAQSWVDRHSLSFPVYADPVVPSTFSPYYDVSLTPMVMLIDVEQMEIIYLNQGFDEEAVQRTIDARLTQELPRQQYPEGPYGVAEGDQIAPVELVQPDGSTYSLADPFSDPSKQLLLVSTSAEWCTACIKEQPKLKELYEVYAPQGLDVLVSVFEDRDFNAATPQIASDWQTRFNLPFTVVADVTMPSVFSAYYDVSLTPMIMLISLDDMRITYLTQGFDQEQVEGLIATQLGVSNTQ